MAVVSSAMRGSWQWCPVRETSSAWHGLAPSHCLSCTLADLLVTTTTTCCHYHYHSLLSLHRFDQLDQFCPLSGSLFSTRGCNGAARDIPLYPYSTPCLCFALPPHPGCVDTPSLWMSLHHLPAAFALLHCCNAVSSGLAAPGSRVQCHEGFMAVVSSAMRGSWQSCPVP